MTPGHRAGWALAFTPGLFVIAVTMAVFVAAMAWEEGL